MIKTLNITGETLVDLSGGESNSYFYENKKYCRIDNKSNGNIYASLSPNVVAGKDGVLEILPQSSGTLELTPANKIYVSGSGKIQIQTSAIPLKVSASGGGDKQEFKQLGIYPIQPDGTYSGEITLPDTMTSIPEKYFQNNKNLTKINLSDSIVSIGNSAFNGCSNISIGTCNINNVYLGAFCFNDSGVTNENVNYITAHSVSNVSTSIFTNCKKLTDISVDLRCGHTMFGYCANLENAVVLSCTTENGSSATFRDCTKLKRVIIPLNGFESNINNTGWNPFVGCTALEEIVLPEGWNHPIRLVTDSFTHDGLVNMINALADLTGKTALTFTLGSVNLAKLSDAEKAIATNKNWILA